MYISKLNIIGFRSFGPSGRTIQIKENLSAFVGLNSSGKTTALEALRKIFGSSNAERELYKKDFHFAKEEDIDSVVSKVLSIEVWLDFSEDELEAIPHFFTHMIVAGEGDNPFIRLRLEASWNASDLEPDGLVESRLFFIKVTDGIAEEEGNKQIFPTHLRSLIQIIYVPAIRRPAEQLKYTTGSILHRVLKKIKWNEAFKTGFDQKINDINQDFKTLPEFDIVQNSITNFWHQFHKDDRYKDTSLGFGGSDFDSILRKLEISFTPTPTYRKFSVDDLGEGYRSLFYLTLVCALLQIEEDLSVDQDEIGISKPLLTILAIEEPENHIAPQLLGRVVNILKVISGKSNSQVLLSSHTPAIVKRVDPEAIFHFRINEDYETEVNQIQLPDKEDEAYKYIKEAVHNYPEIYFAKFVIIGEGDSEEVIFNRLMEIMNLDFDDNVITFAPLGHRFVSHIWRLLKTLRIPYITLLDLDVERNGGGWGRVKYAIKELIKIGVDKDKLLAIEDDKVLSDDRLEKMHTWQLGDKNILSGWVNLLRKFRVFYSSPLDLDFLMLTYYGDFYKKSIPLNGGPKIPNSIIDEKKYTAKVAGAIKATLKSEDAVGDNYTEEEKELMIWYNYHFLGRGKPATHIQVLANMTDEELMVNLPPIFNKIFNRIITILNEGN